MSMFKALASTSGGAEPNFFTQMAGLEKRLQSMKIQSKIAQEAAALPVAQEEVGRSQSNRMGSRESRFSSKEASTRRSRAVSKESNLPHGDGILRSRSGSKESSRFASKEFEDPPESTQSRLASEEFEESPPNRRTSKRMMSRSSNESSSKESIRFQGQSDLEIEVDQISEAALSRLASKQSVSTVIDPDSNRLVTKESVSTTIIPGMNRLISKERRSTSHSPSKMQGSSRAGSKEVPEMSSRFATKESVSTVIHPALSRLASKESAMFPSREMVATELGTIRSRSNSATQDSFTTSDGQDIDGLPGEAEKDASRSASPGSFPKMISRTPHFHRRSLSLAGDEDLGLKEFREASPARSALSPDRKALAWENRELRKENEELKAENEELRMYLSVDMGDKTMTETMYERIKRQRMERSEKEEAEHVVAGWIHRHKDKLMPVVSMKNERSFRGQLFAEKRALAAAKQVPVAKASRNLSGTTSNGTHRSNISESAIDELLQLEAARSASFWNFPQPTGRALFVPKRWLQGTQLNGWQLEWPA